jgi:hypothetical protein
MVVAVVRKLCVKTSMSLSRNFLLIREIVLFQIIETAQRQKGALILPVL